MLGRRDEGVGVVCEHSLLLIVLMLVRGDSMARVGKIEVLPEPKESSIMLQQLHDDNLS